MKLTIKATATPTKNIPFVFFLFENTDITKEPFFKLLAKGEREYLSSIRSHLNIKEKESRVFFMPATERRVIVVGLGPMKDFTQWKAGFATRIAVQAARKEKAKDIAFWAGSIGNEKETLNFFETVAANAAMANFEFVKYKTVPKDGFSFLELIEAVYDKKNRAVEEGLRRGVVIGEEINAARDLTNTPGGDMTPEMLAAHAVKIGKQNPGISVTVLDEKKIKSLGMGGVIGMGQGSDAPPRFIVMEYLKGAKNDKPIVLVGKGVTFDSGGLNLKPDEHIYEMHMDMSGGASVIHTIAAAARLGLKKNIIALIPAVENMVSGKSVRPGDVLKTMNGKTIEVMNTDAEGRVILSDALEYSKKYKPALVVDVATLTGASMVALGLRYSALFTTSKQLEDEFRRVGEETGDRVWPLPLHEDFEENVKGTFGDWANVGKPDRMGGAITAAVFLWQFIKGTPWVHLDIAPRMTAMDEEFLAKGAAGAPIRLLVRFLEEGKEN